MLRRERIGIFEIAEDEYEVRYGALLLGYINGKNKLVRVNPDKTGVPRTETVTQLPGLKTSPP